MDFIQSLMTRNQTDNAQTHTLSGNRLIVQPRQPLRFEEKSLKETAQVPVQEHDSPHIRSELSANMRPQEQSSLEPNKTVPVHNLSSLETIKKIPELNLYSADVKTNSLEKNQEPLFNNSIESSFSKGSFDGPFSAPFIRNNGKTKPVSQEKPLSEEKQPPLIVDHALNQRIQTVLQSLSTNTHTVTNISTDDQLPLREPVKLASQPASSVLGKPDVKRQALSEQNISTGELQTPDWLAELRSGLQQRWQAQNQVANVEPVINVTIGRVDVRAVTESTAPQVNTSKKPVSTMTLESYLEQRDRRRQG
ncbi:hypothetical protein [Neptunomonas japonica]|uniref:Uncharacterized protein n=1 Tax=Neptunomonas japonica JAMM 1380 TaxID=1441457 RepID=A0A7R6PN12_9GAMM|nr:hypothetical protein [Neptunomonas japonica]BBB29397.1 hypothetical protein NEJAP_1445 [Neptunomonas japonica JAMM 1380]